MKNLNLEKSIEISSEIEKNLSALEGCFDEPDGEDPVSDEYGELLWDLTQAWGALDTFLVHFNEDSSP